MRTSITEIIRIEKFLAGQLKREDQLVFEGRLVADTRLQRDVFLHQVVHRLVRLYHRKKLKAQVARMHAQLFQDPAKAQFRESVLQYFNS